MFVWHKNYMKEKALSRVRSIWGHKNEFERYTVFLEHEWDYSGRFRICLKLSDNPDHPQGLSHFTFCKEGEHLGEKLDFDKLPEDIQEHIISRINQWE
jgi:hypothetical protein